MKTKKTKIPHCLVCRASLADRKVMTIIRGKKERVVDIHTDDGKIVCWECWSGMGGEMHLPRFVLQRPSK
jgi:hypothetical protein